MPSKDEYTKGKYVIIIEGEKSKEYNKQNDYKKTQEYYDNTVEEIKRLQVQLNKAKKNDDKALVSYINNSIAGRNGALIMLKNKLNLLGGDNEKTTI